MIREGLWLMAIGMTGVFIFLLILVGLMHVSGRVFAALDRLWPEPVALKPVAMPSIADEEIAVALALASVARRGRAA